MSATQLLEGMAELLQEHGIALYSAEGRSSIFLEYLPERVEHALSLTIYGAEPESLMPPQVAWPRVQIRARGDQRSPRWSRDTLGLVYHLLHGYSGRLPNGVEVRNCHGLQSAPMALGPDAGSRYEHVLNFQLMVCDVAPVPVRRSVSHAST